jgi:hypothetical protein
MRSAVVESSSGIGRPSAVEGMSDVDEAFGCEKAENPKGIENRRGLVDWGGSDDCEGARCGKVTGFAGTARRSGGGRGGGRCLESRCEGGRESVDIGFDMVSSVCTAATGSRDIVYALTAGSMQAMHGGSEILQIPKCRSRV